jgi:hypothetical protein
MRQKTKQKAIQHLPAPLTPAAPHVLSVFDVRIVGLVRLNIMKRQQRVYVQNVALSWKKMLLFPVWNLLRVQEVPVV